MENIAMRYGSTAADAGEEGRGDNEGIRIQRLITSCAALLVVVMGLQGLHTCREFPDIRYGNPLHCHTAECAAATMSDAEHRMVERAVRMVANSRFAATPTGSAIVIALRELKDEGLINIWSTRDPIHSSFNRSKGVVINRYYDKLNSGLIAVALVHEGYHAAAVGSSLQEELAAHFLALDFYEEIKESKHYFHRELEYMRRVRLNGRFHEVFNCGRDLYNSACPGSDMSLLLPSPPAT